jgi:phospholipase C
MDRRTFLQLLSGTAAAAVFPASIRRALAIPAHRRTGTLADVEHVVILMQENRSFDHYFGSLRGVRGFSDPRAVSIAAGNPVWRQPTVVGNPGDGFVLPFHPGAANLGLQFLRDLAHDWTTTHAAVNGGANDQWAREKGAATMAHLTRNDIPFHYALADAFTICDAYHCSLLGPTYPNRYHMWTGWTGNDGQGGGPAVDNSKPGYSWVTYPERLQAAGVSWKIYQDIGLGLDAGGNYGGGQDAYIGNYGCNTLLYFTQYQNAAPDSPLRERAMTGTNIAVGGSLFDRLRGDVLNGSLPQVSWIIPPEAYTEHPNWPANYGAWYVSELLDALTADPEVWSKTVFFLTYDENDGFFDHMPPPAPPQSREQGLSTVATADEIFAGNSEYPAGPYGLGMRVPMIVVSPWSKGGWVASELFDHTSMIRFLEERFGVREPNITAWRRAVAGDLTSAFNFASPNEQLAPLPSTAAYLPPDNQRHPDYAPEPPTEQAMPLQESGRRHARAVPYRLDVRGEVNLGDASLNLSISNSGRAAAVFQVRSGQVRSRDGLGGPWTYTVGPNAELSDAWFFRENPEAGYDLSVYGPNGFLRSFQGGLADANANLRIATDYDLANGSLQLSVLNLGKSLARLTILDGYANERLAWALRPGESLVRAWPCAATFGWYDLLVEAESDPVFRQRLAGHIETGNDSMSDPIIGVQVIGVRTRLLE